MKKILASLLVLALCAPAMADVTVTAVGNGTDLEISIEVTGDSVVRGVALTLDSDGPKPTGASAVNSEFNAYIDAYFEDDTILPALADETALPGTTADGVLAAVGVPGLAVLGTDVDVVLSAGVLDNSGAGGGLDATTGAVALATVSYDGAGNVCLSPDALRGGIVGDDLGTVDVQTECVTLIAATTCRDKVLAEDGSAAADLYDRYVTQSGTYGTNPDSWCWQYQCEGDADNAEQTVFLSGTYRTYQADLNILIPSWQKTPETGADPRADFDHAEQTVFLSGTYSIYQGDLNILVTNWQKTTAELTTCSTYLP